MAQEFSLFSGFEVCDAKARKNIDIMKNRKVIFIGDSYGAGYTPDSTTPNKSWTAYAREFLGLKDGQFYESSINGAGFIHGTTFLTILQTIGETIENKEQITDIVVCGGYNDKGYSVNEIEVAIQTFINYAKENYINAVVRVGHIGWSKDYNRALNCMAVSLPAYRNVVKYGGVYLNNVEYSNHVYEHFTSDGFHPGENAQQSMGYAIASAIVSGSANISYSPRGLTDLIGLFEGCTSNYNDTNKSPVITSLNNNMASLYTKAYISFEFTAKTLTGNSVYDFCKLRDQRYVGGCKSPFHSGTYTPIYITNTSGTSQWVNALLTLTVNSEGDSIISIKILADNNTSYTNIVKINIPPFSMKLDSLYC